MVAFIELNVTVVGWCKSRPFVHVGPAFPKSSHIKFVISRPRLPGNFNGIWPNFKPELAEHRQVTMMTSLLSVANGHNDVFFRHFTNESLIIDA